MQEYSSRKKIQRPESLSGSMNSGAFRQNIPNSSMEAILAGRAHAGAKEMGHRQNLAPSLNAKMSQAFGMDFSGVQLYRTDAMQGQDMQGIARGNQVVLSREIDLNTTAGQAVLGHELSHVRAQHQGLGLGHTGLYQNAALEHQADMEGMMAARGKSILDGSTGMNMGMGMGGIGGLTPLGAGMSASAGAPMQAGKGKKKNTKPAPAKAAPKAAPKSAGKTKAAPVKTPLEKYQIPDLGDKVIGDSENPTPVLGPANVNDFYRTFSELPTKEEKGQKKARPHLDPKLNQNLSEDMSLVDYQKMARQNYLDKIKETDFYQGYNKNFNDLNSSNQFTKRFGTKRGDVNKLSDTKHFLNEEERQVKYNNNNHINKETNEVMGEYHPETEGWMAEQMAPLLSGSKYVINNLNEKKSGLSKKDKQALKRQFYKWMKVMPDTADPDALQDMAIDMDHVSKLTKDMENGKKSLIPHTLDKYKSGGPNLYVSSRASKKVRQALASKKHVSSVAEVDEENYVEPETVKAENPDSYDQDFLDRWNNPKFHLYEQEKEKRGEVPFEDEDEEL